MNNCSKPLAKLTEFCKRLAHSSFLYLREYFFPAGCSVCGTALDGPHETRYGLCENCLAEIERDMNENRTRETCDCCGKPLVSEQGRCLVCRQREQRAFDKAIVLFPYAGKYRRLLRAYKFHHNLGAGNFLAEKIIDTLRGGTFPDDARLVPVPPRPGKIRNSGWDQVEYLARLLEKRRGGNGGPSVSRCLKRLPSQSQKKLSLESRLSNLRGRIVPSRQVPQTAIVLDDVMTTGSTLDSCAAALKAAGTATVYGICLFYDL